MLMTRRQRSLYEAIGTFVLSAASAILLVPLASPAASILPALTPAVTRDVAGVPAGSLAFTLVVAGLTFLLGRRSGAHLNPAVSIAFATGGRFPIGDALAYAAAQLGGGLVAAVLVWPLRPRVALSASASEAPLTSVYAMEWVAALVLGLMLITIAADRRVSRAWSAATVGAAIALMSTLAMAYGGVLNPARALLLAPSLSLGRLLLVYGVGPITAMAVAVYLYDALRGSLMSHAIPPGVALGLAGPILGVAPEPTSRSDAAVGST